jgi:HNH endonuclease/Homing endonuclease associated repeat
MNYQFDRTCIDKIPRHKMLAELESVAEKFNFVEFGKRDFDRHSQISASTAVREFSSWRNAMEALRSRLKVKNIELRPRAKGYFEVLALFDEMRRIWRLLGHRPSRREWESSRPQISYQTYGRYFDGWQNACLAFIEHEMKHPVEVLANRPTTKNSAAPISSRSVVRGVRDPSPRLRLRVLTRDQFRCVLCGRSPAADIGISLQLDHIVPYSEGGETTFENLRTSCSECHLGKGNSEKFGRP